MNYFKARFILLSCMAFSGHTMAETITADRPGFSTGTTTLSPGLVNIEMGYQADFENSQTNHQAPLVNIRTGLTNQLELAVSWSATQQDGKTHSADPAIGVKAQMISTDHYHLSALANITLPTDQNVSQFSKTDFLLGLLWDRSLSVQTSVFGVVQTASNYSQQRDFHHQIALGVSHSYSDKIATYMEAYVDIPQTAGSETAWTANTGITYLATPKVQYDVYVGMNLAGQAADYLGFGVATVF